MSKLFNIFPDSSSEEECDFEDGKTQLCVLKGREMKMNFWWNQRMLACAGRVITDISAAAPLTV